MSQWIGRRVAVAAVVALLGSAVGAQAQGWQWSLAASAWRSSVDLGAELEDHGGTSNVVRIDESVRDHDVAARLALEGRFGRHGLAVDATRWGIEEVERSPGVFGTVVARATLDVTVVDLAGLYNPRGDGDGLSVLYGVRVLDARQTLSVDFSFPFPLPFPVPDLRYDFSEDLVDAMLGARYVQPFASRWSIRARAAVSRGSSKLSWDGEAGIGVAFRADRRYSLRAGYRYLEMKFDSRSGTARIETTVKNRGPELAFGVAW